MVSALLLLTAFGQATTPKLTFQGGAFVVNGASGPEKVLLSTARPATGLDRSRGRLTLTLEKKTVTFDARGLTFAVKGTNYTNRLQAVPVSGKIATKESNEALIRAVKDGSRKLEVSALSGWAVQGKELFLLVRWDDKSGKPWLEALVKVDMGSPRPKPDLVGKFDGLSYARGVVDDVLRIKDGTLWFLAGKEDSFGVASMKTDGSDAVHKRMGDPVAKAELLPGDSTAWTLTPSAYGTSILGFATLDKNEYHLVAEVRGQMRSIVPPCLAEYRSANGEEVVSLRTGALTSMDANAEWRATSSGLLCWWPAKAPTKAVLYDDDFRKLATWDSRAKAATLGAKPKIEVTSKPHKVGRG